MLYKLSVIAVAAALASVPSAPPCDKPAASPPKAPLQFHHTPPRVLVNFA